MLKYKGDLDQVFSALADPTRRAIVDRLTHGDAAVGELAEPFDMSLSAVHQHLAVLRQAGLVSTLKQGRVRKCRLEPGRLDLVDDWVAERRRTWDRRLDDLDRYLRERGGT